MVGLKKSLAVVGLGLLAGLGSEAMAAPFTDTVFVSYHVNRGTKSWARGSGFLIAFVTWRDTNPKANVTNISWVNHWAGEGGAILKEDGTPYAPGEYESEYGTLVRPPWEAKIPEPSSALLATAALGIMALRRKA